MRLTSDRLTVDIADPGTVYQRSRFDWTAFITQVTLDGRHTFCTTEPGKTSTGGVGLCNEFGIFQAIGYDDAAPGEQFPKLGVGLLTKTADRPYNFFMPYAIEPFPLEVVQEASSVHFTVLPLPCRGYAARLEKTVRVAENRLTIDYRLANVGERPLATHEYVHNFLALDGHRLGPDYRLRLPFTVELADTPAELEVQGQEISWRHPPAQAFYCRPGGFAAGAPSCWELTHAASGLAVCEQNDFPLLMLAVWGTAEVVSAEAFFGFDLPPGEVACWSRKYTFGYLG